MGIPKFYAIPLYNKLDDPPSKLGITAILGNLQLSKEKGCYAIMQFQDNEGVEKLIIRISRATYLKFYQELVLGNTLSFYAKEKNGKLWGWRFFSFDQ